MSTKTSTRDLGLDLLRIISMLMVITIHYLGNGGLIDRALQPWTVNWAMGTWINTSCIVCVNLFVMISGYYLCTATFRLSKWLSIWVTAAFYSVVIYLVLCFAGLLPFSVAELVKHGMPFTLEQYWFVTPYLLMYALMPILNAAIRSLTKKQHLLCCCVLMLLFGVLPNFVYINDIVGGKSLLWFCTMYLVAAYFRIYIPTDRVGRRKLMMIFLGGISFSVIWICLMHWITPRIFGKVTLTFIFLNRNSIPHTVASLALFQLFRTVKIRGRVASALIRVAAPTAFSAYLISHHPQLKVFLWDLLSPSDYAGSPWLIVHMFASVTGIFAVCCLIDHIRQWGFKFCRIDSLIRKIGDLITHKVHTRLDKVLK